MDDNKEFDSLIMWNTLNSMLEFDELVQEQLSNLHNRLELLENK